MPNLRALVPVFRILGAEGQDAQLFLVRALAKSLTNRESCGLEDSNVQGWLDTVVKISLDARLREYVTTNRFVAEKQALERRLAELKAETKKAKRRLQRLHEAPDSLEYLSGLVQTDKISLRPAYALLDKLDTDVTYLEQQVRWCWRFFFLFVRGFIN